MNDPKAVYSAKTEQYNVDFEAYNAFGKTFGHFADDGKKYVVTDRNTPRQWLNFMVNDTFGSVAGNDGSGYIFFKTANLAVTKYYSVTDYLVRTLNGRRSIVVTEEGTGAVCDLFADSRDLTFTAEAGRVTYRGTAGEISFSVRIFVPENDPAEIWVVSLKGAGKTYRIAFGQTFSAGEKEKTAPPAVRTENNAVFVPVRAQVFGTVHNVVGFFGTESAFCKTEAEEESYSNGRTFRYVNVVLEQKTRLGDAETVFYAVCGAVDAGEEEKARAVLAKYRSPSAVDAEERAVLRRREEIFGRVKCSLPDKNLQYFLNVWLKNQLFLTMRYNRCDIMGYRDVMQDSWGNLLVEPKESRAPFLEAISKMYADGRCPRQYDRYSEKTDARDFMDSPLWAAVTLTGYIKETGDFSIAEEQAGFLDSEEKSSVKDHLLRAFDYLYHARGKNGLLLMRDGDWLDGLTGISAYGEATTVWGTIAAFYAQNLFADFLEYTGDGAAALLRERSAEYKKVVNTVGWDGNWYAYAFIDEEPIGSHLCHEGKIFLNAQTWAVLSGIADTPDKIEKAMRSVHIYLSGMYGPHLLMPPYTKFGEKCGRLQKHRPGTFSNGAIYLHGAAFKFAADCARGDYAEALDTVQRILPNHEDSCDSRRTSEPYCVGNVYFGIAHPCYGLNLYTWFTATPAWLLQTGVESLLGVKADYDGLRAELHGVPEWGEYTVEKIFRDRRYKIRFVRAEADREKGLYLGGKKLEGTLIPAPEEGEIAEAEVYF